MIENQFECVLDVFECMLNGGHVLYEFLARKPGK